jgi:hypothetical protein
MEPSKYSQQPKLEFFQNSTYRNGLTSLSGTLLAAVAFLALSATFARAQTLTNWLANPGFELGTNGWAYVPPWWWPSQGISWAAQDTNMFVQGSTTVHVGVHGGTNALKEWGYYQPYAQAPGAQQTFAVAPTSTWTADGWVSTQVPNNIGANANGSCSSYLRVLFMDATLNYNAPLASYTSQALTTDSPTGTWLHFQVTNSTGGTTLTAPAGSAFLRFEMLFAQPGPASSVYAGGSSYWDDVSLIRTSKPDPEISVQPVAVTQVYGQTATFSVVADGQTALSYKWQKDGADITDPNAHGATTSTLTLSNVTVAMMGNYTVTVTDVAGPLTSDLAYLTVTDPGIISITPALGQTVVVGTNVTIAVAVASSSTPTYAWYKDGNPLSDDGHYSGVATPMLGISSVTTADTSTNYLLQINGGALSAANGLKVITAAQYATNLLVNPGFEDSVLQLPWETAWTKFNGAVLATTNDYYYLSATPVSVYDGNYVCQVYNSDADDGYYQTVPVTAGATYHAGGSFYMSQYSALAGSSTVTLQFSFKNAAGATLAAFTAPAVTATSAMDTWTALQVTNDAGGIDLVAPAAAVSASVQVYEFNWTYAGGSVYADDLYLTRANLPPPPAVTIAATAVGGQMNLSFPTTSGVTYEVLYADSLNSPSTWRTNKSIAGNGTVKGISDPIGATKRFYRVLEHY